MTTGNVRVAAAAAGVFVTLVVILVTLAVVSSSVNAAPADTEADDEPPKSDLLKHLSLLYQGTYVLYGKGRRSERDLPVCATPAEACNLAHRRYWLTPITERLCRCADKSECPLHFTSLNDTQSQHVSNRAQLKFCSPIVEELPLCANGEPALKIKKVERKGSPYPPFGTVKTEGVDTHSTLLCHCPWPNRWTLSQTTTTSPTETFLLYTCDQLPKCKTEEECGHIRADTLESYYSCSCPEQHVCVFERPQRAAFTSELHFEGHAYTAQCTPN
ncbi:uncharacterized protein [Macrobrachium rosenbergii]|uniref:uncharacterized protein n=1 Tax=Macrobrachium rosenbergii TaxID=79674 RepID=UPI0034D3E4D2